MTCASCGDKSKKNNSFTKAVIEIENPEQLILFRKVIIPASMGDDEAVPPTVGKYRNVLLQYEANGKIYLYSSDGIPTLMESGIPQEVLDRLDLLDREMAEETETRQAADATLQNNITAEATARSSADATLQNNITAEATARSNADTALQNSITAEATARSNADTALGDRLTTVEGIAGTALQPQSINKVVMTDIDLSANASTTTVQLEGSKENILTGATSTKNVPLPVASTTQAGVMNSATFDAVTANTNNLSAIMNGAVAITGISASPSQSDLTTAWQTETGLTTLINRASIYDVSNDKVWTYYTNDTTWHAASNTSQVTINTFTNNSEGTIKGSTNIGQIFAENNGTGSVNGWDALSGAVATNTSDIAALQAAIPTVNDATLTIQNNGTNVATFTANSATNTTANIIPPVQIGSVLSTPNLDFVNTGNIVDGAVTNAKLAQGAASDKALNINLGNNVDLDTITETGFYRFYEPYTNSPVDSHTNPYGSMLVISYSDDYRCTQLFVANPDGYARMYMRNSYYDYVQEVRAWSAWQELTNRSKNHTDDNITPTADTPAAWATALSGDGDGLYITKYTTANLFTDQHNLGIAETIVIGNEVVQRWYEESGVIWWRHGSGSTWSTTSSATGDSFLVVEDSTTTHIGAGVILPHNVSLNTVDYAMPGSYTGLGSAMTDCPTDATFRMEVHEVGRRLRVTPATSDMRLIRVLSDYDGSIFVQRVWSDSQTQWHFDAWRTISGGNDGLHPYSWAFTPSSNYTVDFGNIYLKSDILLLNIGVHKNSGTIGADEVIGQLANWAAPAHEVMAASYLSNSSNFATQAIGYLYIDGKDSYTPANIGQVIISDSAASHTHAKIYIWIPIK